MTSLRLPMLEIVIAAAIGASVLSIATSLIT
jgi:hypothetical protein